MLSCRRSAALALVAVASLFSVDSAKAAVEARRAYDFVNGIGVNTHFGYQKTTYDTNIGAVIDALNDLGIRHIRDRPSNKFTMDRLRRVTGETGVLLTAIVDSIPPPGTRWHTRPLDVSGVPAYLRDMVKGVDPSTIGAIEGPNEYDMGSKSGNDNWASSLRAYAVALHAAVKAMPELADHPIIAPSLAMNQASYFEQLGNLSAVSDIGNLHAYTADRPISAAIDEYLQNVDYVNPGQPVAITEFGWNTAMQKWQSHPMKPKSRAKYIMRALAEIFSRPRIERSFIYQLADERPNPGEDEPEEHFGLLTSDVKPTPTYYALRNTMMLLCDDHPDLQTKPLDVTISGSSEVHRVLLQKGSGIYYLLVWQDGRSYEQPKLTNALQAREWTLAPVSLTLKFTHQPASVRTYLPTALDGDANGGLLPKETFKQMDSVTLSVPDELMVVEIVPEGGTVSETRSRCTFTPRQS